MARLLLLDAFTKDFNDVVREIECNDLDDYYKYLKCDCFDIANRKIGDDRYDIFVDDCGLFVNHPIVSAIEDDTFYPMLVGNLIFAKHNAAGETISLTDEDMNNIKKHIVLADGKQCSMFVVMCNY